MNQSQFKKGELWALLAVLVLSTTLMSLLLQKDFTGPDATSYLGFARSAQLLGYFFDPIAFEGNFFPMGYPTVLSLTLQVTHGSTLLYQVLSIGMGLSVVICLWFVCLPMRPTVRLTITSVVALSPALMWMSQNNGYEMLLCFLITVSFALVLRQGFIWLPLLPSGAIAGVCMGLAMLCQSKVIAIIPVLAFLAWKPVKRRVLFFIGLVILPISWSIRNVFVTGSPSPFSSNGEMGIWLGNNPFTQTGGVVASMPPKPPGFSNLVIASAHFIYTQPETAYSLFTRRLARLLEPTYLYRDQLAHDGVNVALHWLFIAFTFSAVALFCAYAFGRLWTRPPVLPQVGAAASLTLCFFFVHFPFQSEPRYMLPIVPIALVVSVSTAFSLSERGWRVISRHRAHQAC